METRRFIVLALILLFCNLFAAAKSYAGPNEKTASNGEVVLAYKGFEKFLDAEHTWENYQKYVLEPYPAVKKLHGKYQQWGLIDKGSFPEKIAGVSESKYRQILKDVNDREICSIYNSTVHRCNAALTPKEKIDICFFLGTIKDCLMFSVSGRKTILISVEYEPEKLPLIIIHEYAHCLHYEYKPPRQSRLLSDSIVNEGVASFFPTLVDKDASIYEGLWMMPKPAVDWCVANEKLIIDTIRPDLNKAGLEIEKKYICSGEGFAKPPEGFPEKTGYYIGYRIVEKCLEEMPLEELCSMSRDEVIAKSRFFE